MSLEDMIAALDVEITAIDNQMNGGRTIRLHNGKRFGHNDHEWLYAFTSASDVTIRNDAAIELQVDQVEYQGNVASCRDNRVVIALAQDIGPTVSDARLIIDNSFLIRRLKDQLQQIQQDEVSFNRDMANHVINGNHVVAPQPIPAVPHSRHIQNLNQGQRNAVNLSLANKITYVWGPPGTGKTTTVAGIVEARYRAGHTVLLVANTNIAVDTALESVLKSLDNNDEGLRSGRIIRHGPIIKDELRQQFGNMVDTEKIVARKGSQLQAEKRDILCRMEKCQHKLQSDQAALEQVKKLAKCQQQLADIENTLGQTQDEASEAHVDLTNQQSHLKGLRTQLGQAQAMNRIWRFLRGISIYEIIRHIEQTERHLRNLNPIIEELRVKVESLQSRATLFRQATANLEQATRAYPTQQELLDAISANENVIAASRYRIDEIERTLGEMEGQIMQNCRIMATTVYRTYLKRNIWKQYDVVVIDEASMLMPPLVYCASGLAQKAVIIAGDFRQLPPIVISTNNELSDSWLKQDVFYKAAIPALLEQNVDVPNLASLRTQYRMSDPICQMVNDLFYNDCRMISAKNEDPKDNLFPFGQSPLLYMDTSSLKPWAAYRAGSRSRYNTIHASLVSKIILQLDDGGYLPEMEDPNGRIGVVSPYSAQARLIQAMLEAHLDGRAAGLATTVHRFQGNQKETMIIDLTDSTGVSLGKFLRAVHMQEDGARLLNVAASRAQKHLIVLGNFNYLLGNFNYLQNRAAPNTFVRRMISHLMEHGEAIEISQVLPQNDTHWMDDGIDVQDDKPNIAADSVGVFNGQSFNLAFRADVLNAQSSIDIYCPFIWRNHIQRWLTYLRRAMLKGVSIRVITRPPQNSRNSEAVNILATENVNIEYIERMHQKVAIIDGKIVWHGSLNIFAQTNAGESMLRFDNQRLCSQILRYL